MTNEKRLETVLRACRMNWNEQYGLKWDEVKKDPAKWIESPLIADGNRALLELYVDATESMDKQKTPASTLSALKRILKNSDRWPAPTEKNGLWYYTDGCRVYAMKTKPDSIPAASGEQRFEHTEVIHDILKNATVEVPAPSLYDVKNALIDMKAAEGTKRKRGNHGYPYNIPGSRTWVDAEKLVDLLTVFPNAKMYVNPSPLCGIAVKAPESDETAAFGILMPVRHTETEKESA